MCITQLQGNRCDKRLARRSAFSLRNLYYTVRCTSRELNLYPSELRHTLQFALTDCWLPFKFLNAGLLLAPRLSSRLANYDTKHEFLATRFTSATLKLYAKLPCDTIRSSRIRPYRFSVFFNPLVSPSFYRTVIVDKRIISFSYGAA